MLNTGAEPIMSSPNRPESAGRIPHPAEISIHSTAFPPLSRRELRDRTRPARTAPSPAGFPGTPHRQAVAAFPLPVADAPAPSPVRLPANTFVASAATIGATQLPPVPATPVRPSGHRSPRRRRRRRILLTSAMSGLCLAAGFTLGIWLAPAVQAMFP